MTRDNSRGESPEEEGQSAGDSDVGVDAAAETRVLIDDAATAETVLAEDLPEMAETVVAEDFPEMAETRVVMDDESDDTQNDAEEEDERTQLVPRDRAERVSQDAVSAQPAGGKETRVLDPAAGAVGNAGRDGARRVPDTRVLEEPDKTAPPAVAAAAKPASRPASATPVAPIDPNRGLAPGTVLFGEYEIVNVLGVGGMGEVYRARHRRLDEHRAIKVMHAELSKKKGASEFFYREAKALLAVRHPAVAHCHDLLSDDEGRVYLIMEMIEGIPLSKKMNDGPLSPDEVAILGARVSHGLSAAHRKGVIHRDVSPDNIVLPNGRVQEAKLIDFGIAKLLEEGEGTIVDGFKGKLSYASPEQLGFFGGKIDGRSDFYSLGLVLVAAALGRPMGMGTTVVEAVDARRAFGALPDAIPMGLRSAIQPLLALDPDDRPKYVDRLFVVPDGMEGSTDSGRISTGGIARTKKGSGDQGRLGMIAAAVGAVVLLAGAGLYMTLGSSDSGSVTPTTPTNAETPAQGTKTPAAAAVPAAKEPVVPAVVEKTPVVAKKPVVRRPSTTDLLKIRGALNQASLALTENRLMSPKNDNAFDRYQFVLGLDPRNAPAKAGLRDIASRYIAMAERSIDKGDFDQAQTFADRARMADASFPGLATLEARLSR